MSTFFTILILFFIVTAIWQIVKIYDLTQVNTVKKVLIYIYLNINNESFHFL